MSPPRVRVHHRVHAVEDGVAGEQHPLLLEQEAEVVRGVARACAARRGPTRCPRWCRPRRSPGRGRSSLSLSRCFPKASDLGAGGLHEPRGARAQWSGWVWVSTHPPDPLLHRRPDDRVDVGLHVGPRVDDRDLVDADEVGVGARAGERPRVRGDDPPHQRRRARSGRPASGRASGRRLPPFGMLVAVRGVAPTSQHASLGPRLRAPRAVERRPATRRESAVEERRRPAGIGAGRAPQRAPASAR